MERRDFIGGVSLAALGMLPIGKTIAAESKTGREIAVFTKYFEKLSYHQLAETIAPLEVAGLEVPLRKGSHNIEPQELAEKLPAFVAALAKKDLATVRKWLA